MKQLGSLAQRPFSYISNLSRGRKLDLFFSIIKPTCGARVLDLGGEASHETQPNKQLLDVYPHRSSLVLVNLRFQNAKIARERLPGLTSICGSRLSLPFADKSFDICYCNAVVEHLFSFENQRIFSREIMRVARKWFVTTPNRWFPFEPHSRLPFITWLPQNWQHWIGYQIGYNHILKRYARGADRSEIRLLSRRELQDLFPRSRVISNRVFGLTPTFVVVGGEGISDTSRVRPSAESDVGN